MAGKGNPAQVAETDMAHTGQNKLGCGTERRQWQGTAASFAPRGAVVRLPLVLISIVLCLTALEPPSLCQGEPLVFDDAIARMVALYNDPWYGPPVFENASSREISLYNDPYSAGVVFENVSSREVSLFTDPYSSGMTIESAWSREISAYNDPYSAGVAISNAVSREVSVNNDPSVVVPTDSVVSREISVSNRPFDDVPPETTITAGLAPGGLVCPGDVKLEFEGVDAIAPAYTLVYRWRLDGGPWSEHAAEVSVTLTGLVSGQHTFEVAAADPDANEDPTPASRTFTVDTTAPSVSGVSASPAATTAVVTWTTNEPANSRVQYGTTESLGSQTALVSGLRTNHSTVVSGLEAETRYYYRTVSADNCGHQGASSIQSFRTTSLVLAPVIEAIPDASALEGAAYNGPVPQLTQGDPPVTWSLIDGPAGMTVNQSTGQVSWAACEGSDRPHSITIKAANDAGSDTENWALSVVPGYTATVETDTDVARAGTPVLFTGTATRLTGGQPASNVPVAIVVQVKGIVRVLNGRTDSSGAFQTVFNPLPREAGQYLVGARHPGVTGNPVQDDFILVGMETSPASISAVLIPGEQIAGQVDVTNLGDTPLTGISAVVEGAPAGLSVTAIAPPSLEADGTAPLFYTALATGGQWSGTVTVRIASAEGALAELPLYISVRPPTPELTVTPGVVSAGMLRDSQTFVQFQVTNTGGGATGEIPVGIPALSWMALSSPAVIPPLAPAESATIVLSLTPSASLELGLYSGSIAIASGSSYGKLVPYRFTCISDGVGDLRVIAEDEFTYYAPGQPPVVGADVVLTDPVTGEVVTQGVTGEDGSILFQGLAEAYYTLRVTAEKHNAYDAPVLVRNAQTVEVRAFLPRQLVTYHFSVSPVVVEDRYDIRLEAVFETNVPAPVITVTPGLVNLQSFSAPAQHTFRISNHGLIAANNVRLRWTNGNGISITPLSPNLGDLGAGDEIDAPVRFDPDDGGGGGADPCSRARLWLEYDLVCGVPRVYSVNVELMQDGQVCPGASIIGGGEGGGGGELNPVAFGPVVAQPVNCDPCDLERLKVLLGCVIDFIPIQPCISTALGVRDCWDCAWDDTQDRVICALGCYGTMLNAADCVGAGIPYVGHVLTATRCLYNLYNACDGLPGHDAAVMGEGVGLAGSTVSTIEYVRIHADRLQALSDAYQEMLGNDAWLEGAPSGAPAMAVWMDALKAALAGSSEAGAYIGETEKSVLIQSRPAWVDDADVLAFAVRWNRTLDYWNQGIFDEADLPAGWDADFIALDRLHAKWNAADAALRANLAEGFDSVFGGAKYAADVVRYDIDGTMPDGSGSPPEEGICARVRLRIDQRAVISRTAFRASLQLDNAGDAPIENLFVQLIVRDAENNDSTSLFSVSNPTLAGLTAVDGTGTLAVAASGTADWTIIPTDEAAPYAQTIYTVGGTMSYTLNGAEFEIPLYPARINVLPNPSLHLKYFWQKDVYSDDPFTPEVEPAEPFSLGLVMENRGAGTADNVRITTSQPRIVDNEKGLVIDFTIIGTQVNAADVSPSLNVDLGDVGAGQTAVARWLMTSTLQGEFVEYEATYEHLDGLGDSRLSLIDSVEIHELIHAVRVVYPSDDLRPDFLANDIPDIGGIPETVHGSDASVHPVGLAANPITDGPVTAAHREISLTAAAPVGYMYLRVDDPGGDDFRLVRAVRSDGRVIRLQDNAWTTHRTIRLQGQAPYREHLLHLFDFNSTGAYTLYYEAVTADTILPGEARTKADGDFVEIGAGTGVVVTGVFPDGFYVEAPDRSSGIRVTGSQAAEGDRIVVSGAMATAPNGERVIAADAITKLGTGQIAPCVLTIRSLFGGDFHFDPLSGAGQKGMLGGSGLNPVGLLAQVTGRVTALGTGSFTISESAGVHPVKVQTPVEAPLPALESIVVVTGIVSCEKQATGLLPVVRARRASDIRAETVGPVISDVSVSFITINSARVSWKTDVAGSTEVRLGNSPGAYDRTITADGTALSHVVYAAGLTPATAYYLVVVSRDPVTGITSRSAEITFSTRDWGDVAAAKRTSDGEDIELGALVVTACFDGFFYVQRPDRSGGGLRVAWDDQVQTGRAVEIVGTMVTTADGERMLTAAAVVDRGAYEAPVVFLGGTAVGGSPYFYDPVGMSGQMGVFVQVWRVNETAPWRKVSMPGLNNIGLLVRIAGTVRHIEPGSFYLDDGSTYGDLASPGINVQFPAGAAAPPAGAIAVVTGISSLYRTDDGVYRLMLVAGAEDIVH